MRTGSTRITRAVTGAEANDNGLIRFHWLREGLDELLCNRRLHGLQLENFKRGKVNESLAIFRQNHFELEFTLGTMIGIANIAGVGGMKRFLEPALKGVQGTGIEREKAIGMAMLKSYVSGDPHGKAKDSDLFVSQIRNISSDELGHRGRRAYEIFQKFPPSDSKLFTDLGEFALDPDEKLTN